MYTEAEKRTMTETTGATESQADSGTQPPAGTATSQADDAKQQPESISLEEAKKLRSEASGLRRRLKELEDAAASTAAQSQTETERAIAKAKRDGVEETTTRFQAQLRRATVKAELVAAGIDPDLVDLAAKDDVFADLSVSEDGEVEGLPAAIAAFKKARPKVFAKAGDFGGGNRGATPETPRSMDDLLRAAAGH